MLKKNQLRVEANFNFQTPIKHVVSVRNLSTTDFQIMSNYYGLQIDEKDKHQQISVKLQIDRSIIDNRETVTRDIAKIIFNNEIFDIHIERRYSLHNIKPKENRYQVKYRSNQFQCKVEVCHEFLSSYYKQTVLSEFEKSRQFFNNKKRKRLQNNNQKKKGLTKEDIFIRDLYYADMDRYTYSPNCDANRSYREVFGGDLTNYARRR